MRDQCHTVAHSKRPTKQPTHHQAIVGLCVLLGLHLKLGPQRGQLLCSRQRGGKGAKCGTLCTSWGTSGVMRARCDDRSPQ